MKTEWTIAAIAAAGLLAVACGQKDEATSKNEAQAPPAAAAAAPNAADTIKARQTNLKKLGGALKAMTDESKKDNADLAVFKTQAPIVAGLAPQLHDWFPAGTGAEAGVKTAAKPEIWAQPDVFKQRADAFAAASAKFSTTVDGGDLTAIKAGVAPLGGACRECHQTFRQRDES